MEDILELAPAPPIPAAQFAFSRGGRRFTVPAACVLEIAEPPRVTPVPGAPATIAGIFAWRTSMVPLLALPSGDAAPKYALVVELVWRGARTSVAIPADELLGESVAPANAEPLDLPALLEHCAQGNPDNGTARAPNAAHGAAMGEMS